MAAWQKKGPFGTISEQARCAMEGFVIYMVFNYFIAGILTLHGSYFGVDYSQDAGAGTGLAMIANIKTLDMGMLGAIFIYLPFIYGPAVCDGGI